MFTIYLLAWIPMLALAIFNGAMREATYGKHMSELRAHQVSTVTGSLLIGLFIFGLTRIWRLEIARQAVEIGLIWVVLTTAFEFLFGHFVAKHPWGRLLRDYNIFEGRVWVLFLVWLAVAPWLFCCFQ
jgi:hypothetical protein